MKAVVTKKFYAEVERFAKHRQLSVASVVRMAVIAMVRPEAKL